MYKKFLNFFVIVNLARNVYSDWESPFLITEREDVIIELRFTDHVRITMNEEIIAPFTLAYLNEYSGNESPNIVQFDIGEMINLGLKFEKSDSNWSMIITKTQDYENEDNRMYIFQVKIGSTTVILEIVVINIFDNPPIVFYENPCVVEELTEDNYISQCLYKVTDVDGMTNNNIRFEVQGNFDENNIFGFKLNESLKEDNSLFYNLMLKQHLDYDIRFFYSFRATVFDAGDNQFSFNIIVEVEDVPNKNPMWIRVFASAQFLEKEPQKFEAHAIDGDMGINAAICYNVEFDDDKDFSSLISMNEISGEINIESIDRDRLKIDIFPFYIRAYECDDGESWIRNSAVLLVEDINDNIPNIFITKNIIEMYEETFYTLFQTGDLTIDDIDLGKNAMYNVVLEPEKFATAFNIVPQNGYQQQSFSISVLNANLLDYEVPEFQNFNVSIIATETYNTSHSSEQIFQVRLLNWNDELPQFEVDEYIFSLNETVGANYVIGTVKASDRDVDDSVVYFLNEKIEELFFLNSTSGELSTILNKTFDYEQQSIMTFQVFARDTLQTRGEPTHLTSTQIQINVIDINDTPPTIVLPRKFLTITENEFSAIITNEIKIYDPDTTANLKVYIDWSLSVASGLNVQKEDYEECIDIFPKALNNKEIIGTLKSSATNIIDYEKFQVLFLTITVVDLNTEINDNSTTAVLTILVLDVNDNAPEFVGNTLEVKRSVIEESEADIFIGFIHAIDRDGPGNNEITFSLKPHDYTTDQWIKISSKSGELSVAKSRSIDCDVPKRFTLDYEVEISDGALTSSGNISITINDINNKIPEIEDDNNDDIEIFENSSNIFLTKVKAFDLDRDEPHNTVQYTLNYQTNMELQRYFSIDLKTGELRVKELDEYNKLDRDTEPTEYNISIFIEDNLGIGARNGIYKIVRVKLLDVNDNAPKMPTKLNFVTLPIYESFDKLTTLVEEFYAPDIDEGLNGQVLYKILSIEPIEVDREWMPSDYKDLFVLENYEFKYTRIKTGMNLKRFSGRWSLTIVAVDRGDQVEGGVSQSSEYSYEIKIEPVNFNNPIIIFPSMDILRFDYGACDVGKTLILLNGSKLSPFEAFDDDAGIFGNVDFFIENDFHNIFEFSKINKTFSELNLRSAIEEKVYEISIFAIDGGNLKSDKKTISLAFVDKTRQPYFEDTTWTTTFTENKTGLEEYVLIPRALDPKNYGIQTGELEFQIFYYHDKTYRPNDAQFFALNTSTRILKLTQMLDREMIDRHYVRIIASNEDTTMPALRFVSDSAILNIEIIVEDVNDNPPSFMYDQYFVGISERDNLGKILITLEATDPDLNDIINYKLLKDTIQVSNTELNYLKDSAFIINEKSGILTLNFEVKASMYGYFTFKAEARDLVNHTDSANIKIYIVAEINRVTFTFRNTVEEVKAVDQSILSQIFSEAYNADCIIDDILPYQTSIGIVDEDETNMRVHFVRENEAINAEEIEQRSSDIPFITELVSKLNIRLSLTLKGLPTYTSEYNNENINRNKILEIVLGTVTCVSCISLITVIVLYMMQRKNYNRQIEALSEKKNDADSQNFKNVKALPNTNMYTSGVSQFNPTVLGNIDENKDFDTKSIISSDSDDFADLSKNQIFNINSQLNNSTNA